MSWNRPWGEWDESCCLWIFSDTFIGVIGSARAGYCTYCQGAGGGEVVCRESYVSWPNADGTMNRTVGGSLCTYFYYTAGGGLEPSEFDQYWDAAYAGRGAFQFGIKFVIEHLDYNPYYATCDSDEGARLDAANFDVAKRQVANIPTGKIAKAGELVKVSYDDGSWEVWMVAFPYSSEPLNTTPIRGPYGCD